MQLRSNFNSTPRYPTRLSIQKNDVHLNRLSELLGIAECDNRVNDEEYSFKDKIETRQSVSDISVMMTLRSSEASRDLLAIMNHPACKRMIINYRLIIVCIQSCDSQLSCLRLRLNYHCAVISKLHQTSSRIDI